MTQITRRAALLQSLVVVLLAGACAAPTPTAGQSAPATGTEASKPAGATAPTKWDFAGSTTWYGHAPIMVAIDKGFFKEQGLDVELQPIPASADRLKAISSSSAPWGNLGRLAVIASAARGDETFSYFGNIDDSPGVEGCYAKPGIDSIQDLRGKKVAANTSAEVTLHELLEDNGMSIKDVQYIDMGINNMGLALKQGDIDAACLWEPTLSDVKQQVAGGKMLGMDTDTSTYKQFKTAHAPDLLVINRRMANDYPEQAKKLATAVFKGVDYTLKNPDDTAKTIAHYFKKEPAEVLAGMKQFQYFDLASQPEHERLHDGQMVHLSDWLLKNNRIDKKPDLTKWADYRFLPKA